MGRQLKVRWTDSARDLADQLERERDPRRRKRLRALLMLREGRRIGEVSDAVGADYRTVQRWVAWYRAGGLELLLRRTPGHGAPGRPPKLNAAQTQTLVTAYQSGQLGSVQDAVDWAANHYGVVLTYTGMWAHLRRAMRRYTADGIPRPPVSSD